MAVTIGKRAARAAGHIGLDGVDQLLKFRASDGSHATGRGLVRGVAETFNGDYRGIRWDVLGWSRGGGTGWGGSHGFLPGGGRGWAGCLAPGETDKQQTGQVVFAHCRDSSREDRSTNKNPSTKWVWRCLFR